MKSEYQRLQKVWDQPERAKQNTELSDNIKLDEVMGSIFTSGASYFYIIDFYDMSLSNMSSSVKEIHGLDAETTTYNDILGLIHPEDVSFITKAEDKVINFFRNEVGWDKVTKYKHSYCFRFKCTDNTYKLFLHQAIQFTLDDEGGFGKALNIHTDISHLTVDNNYKISFIGLEGEPSFIGVELPKQGNSMNTPITFTKREVEIIKLISEGYTNIQIASCLFIAPDTAKNHRRNILEKAGVKNTAHLIKKCMLEGLI